MLAPLLYRKTADNSSGGSLCNYPVKTHCSLGPVIVSCRDHFVYGTSQWEMTLYCNAVSHWLGAYTKWSLQLCESSHSLGHMLVFVYSLSMCLLLWGSITPYTSEEYNWQGWGQFPFFNSIPIPIPLFSIPIPIPIPLLTISFNSNSNSNSKHFNSNSNSGELKSNLNSWNDLWMFSSKFIMIIITRYMYTKLLLLIPSVSYPLLNGYNYMALVEPISIAQYKKDITRHVRCV